MNQDPSMLDRGPTSRTAADIATDLLAAAVGWLTDFEHTAAPSLVPPGSYGGHPTRDDVRADLLYVLGLLIEAGIGRIGQVDLVDRAHLLLEELDPANVEGFYAYRVAETVARLGGLEGLPPDLRSGALEASRSPQLIKAIASKSADMSANQRVVAARCLSALADLGDAGAVATLDKLLEGLREMFAKSSTGWVDDGRTGLVQFDIYTPDMYLLAEPLARDLGVVWSSGFADVVADLDDLAHPSGAVVWGRSVGALAQVMTIEVGGAVARWDLSARTAVWLARAANALVDLHSWFSQGVITADQGRSSDPYRGPRRRLQMTLDIYGKVLLSARMLRDAPRADHTEGSATMWQHVDRLIPFDVKGTACAWAHRSAQLSFVLPLTRGRTSDYLPSPRAPGLLEQPVCGHPVLVPVVTRRAVSSHMGETFVQLVPAGLPVEVVHRTGGLLVRHEGWAPMGEDCDHPEALGGTRTATYHVRGRTLRVREQLRFDYVGLGGSICISIGERADRPLTVEIDGNGRRLTIDTRGLAEWRTPWGELSTVHQLELPLSHLVDLTWSVTAPLTVASTDFEHHYSASLYASMGHRAIVKSAGSCDEFLTERLRGVDILHLAWPERWSGLDPARTVNVIHQIREAGTAIAWTQHNLLPHRGRSDSATSSYAIWASAADVVIHHSHYGERVARATYQYGNHTRHVVIPHGHWGAYYAAYKDVTREEVEVEEGWAPCSIRLGLIGQPRVEKELQLVLDAVADSSRSDIQLVARVSPDVVVPHDDRIIVEYGHLATRRFHRRMSAFDAIVLPFATAGMLTTGTVADCIGRGVATITSDWGYLQEVLFGASIHYGTSRAGLTACIDGLTRAQIEASRVAIAALRPTCEWDDIADRTLTLFEEVASTAEIDVPLDGGGLSGREQSHGQEER